MFSDQPGDWRELEGGTYSCLTPMVQHRPGGLEAIVTGLSGSKKDVCRAIASAEGRTATTEQFERRVCQPGQESGRQEAEEI